MTIFTSPKAFLLAESFPKFGKHRIYIISYPFDVPSYTTLSSNTAGNAMYESSWEVSFV
jgi:hypothetical protein